MTATYNQMFMALLALDSYNRGYDPKLDLSTVTNIGTANVLNTALPTGHELAGFYAAAYSYDGGTVISYRGTDGPMDVVTGWITGAGAFMSPQALMAENDDYCGVERVAA